MPGAGGEAKMEGCAMLPAIRLVSEAAEFAAHRHDAQGAPRQALNHQPVASLLAFATDSADTELSQPAGARHRRGHRDHARGNRAEIRRARCSLVVLTDDMNLSQTERRQRQVEDAPHKSPGAKLIKIADKISNIRARIVPNPAQAQRRDLVAYAIWAEKVVAGCRGVNARLDAEFDETVEVARRLF